MTDIQNLGNQQTHAPETGPRENGFEFRGNAREWFGIWIVNLLLSIITLTIYSAWAKVRRKKYFYNNTWVGGRNFDYHATGGQILIGRLLVIVVLAALNILALITGSVYILTIAVALAAPWLIVRSTMFNARMSSFSNVRFNFAGGMGQAYLVYLVYPVLVLLSLFLTWPILDRVRKRFQVGMHRFGVADFDMGAPLAPLYKAFLAAVAWMLLVGTVIAYFVGSYFDPELLSVITLEPGDPSLNEYPEGYANFLIAASLGLYAFGILGVLMGMYIYAVLVRNVVYNHTTLEGGHGFHSDIAPLALIWISVSNVVVTIVSLGLMLPWTQVRMTRYLAGHTTLLLNGSLDDFADEQKAQIDAIGESYTDLEGVDVGLPI